MKKMLFAFSCMLFVSVLFAPPSYGKNYDTETTCFSDVGIPADVISIGSEPVFVCYDLVFIAPEIFVIPETPKGYGITLINEYENYRKLQEYERQFYNMKC